MFKYALKRIALMLMTVFIIMCMCFILIRMLPPVPLPQGDPHTEVLMARREAMGYNKPIIVAHSAIQMADCRKGPCGRPSCTSKPSGTH